MKVFLVKKSVQYGFDHEVEYLSHEEAEQAIVKILEDAKKRDIERAQWLAAHPKPWNPQEQTHAWVEGFNKKETAVELFHSLGYHVEEKEATPTVNRLNTLPSDSPEMVREIEAKVKEFGACEINWTCTGNSRAAWQSEAACEQLKAMHPEWKVWVSVSFWRVYITTNPPTKKEVA